MLRGRRTGIAAALALAAVAAVTAGCGGGSTSSAPPARPGRGRCYQDAERGRSARAPEHGDQRPGTQTRDARVRRDRRHERRDELQARLDGRAVGAAAPARQPQGDRARGGRRLRHLPEARLPLVPAARRQAVGQARPHEARQVGRARSRPADVRQPAPAERSPRDARGRGSQGAEARPGDHRRRRHDALPRQGRPGQGTAGERVDESDAQGDRRPDEDGNRSGLDRQGTASFAASGWPTAWKRSRATPTRP